MKVGANQREAARRAAQQEADAKIKKDEIENDITLVIFFILFNIKVILFIYLFNRKLTNSGKMRRYKQIKWLHSENLMQLKKKKKKTI